MIVEWLKRLFGPSTSSYTNVPGAKLEPGLGGGPPTVVYPSPPPPQRFPTVEDARRERELTGVPLGYGGAGSSVQPFLSTDQSARQRVVPLRLGMQAANNTMLSGNRLGALPATPLTQEQADRNAISYLAARESALATLGFDPRRETTSPESTARMNIGGFYMPKYDEIWTSGVSKTTPIHEAFHRGFERLRRDGNLPAEMNNIREEDVVRMMMSHYFGDAEIKPDADAGNAQVRQAQKNLKAPEYQALIKSIESAAAQKLSRHKGPGN